MQRVPRPVFPPHVCVITLRGDDPDGFFTANTRIMGVDPHAYVSAAAVRQMASDLGWLDPEGAQALLDEKTSLEREVADLTGQLAEADRQLTAIDALESAGFVARKKPGRPKTRQEA